MKRRVDTEHPLKYPISGVPNNYNAQYRAGWAAPAGSPCPYAVNAVGLRCAWLAGHYDSHGQAAWAKASGNKIPFGCE